MKTELTVRVSRKDILESQPCNAARCAVSVALRRAILRRFRRWELCPTDVIVGTSAMVTRRRGTGREIQVMHHKLHDDVRQWTVAFDETRELPLRRLDLEPFEFTVQLLPTAFGKAEVRS